VHNVTYGVATNSLIMTSTELDNIVSIDYIPETTEIVGIKEKGQIVKINFSNKTDVPSGNTESTINCITCQ